MHAYVPPILTSAMSSDQQNALHTIVQASIPGQFTM